MGERRARTRIEFHATADVDTDAGALSGVETRDLSHKGVFLLGEGSLALGTECAVSIHLFADGEDAPVLHMKGKVARVSAQGTAVDFTTMDPDTYLHLRKLLLLNAEDPEAVEKEFVTAAFGKTPDQD